MKPAKYFLVGLLAVSFFGGAVWVSAANYRPAERAVMIEKIQRLIFLLNQLLLLRQRELATSTPPSLSATTAPRPSSPIAPAGISPLAPTAPRVEPPIILGISPNHGPIGTPVRLTGRGFAPSGNIVYTGYGHLILPSADGQTLSFTINPPIPAQLASLKMSDFPRLVYRIYVKNSNGLTDSPALFNLDF